MDIVAFRSGVFRQPQKGGVSHPIQLAEFNTIVSRFGFLIILKISFVLLVLNGVTFESLQD